MIPIFPQIVYRSTGPTRQILKRVAYLNYLWLKWQLHGIPRYIDCQATVHGWNLSIPDSASFLFSYREMFVDAIYAFRSGNPNPRILDIGANIGLSILFFKTLYPGSHITAFEADPHIYAYLTRNVHGNGYSDVHLINKAVWDQATTLSFFSEGADGGQVVLQQQSDVIQVESVDIAAFLDRHSFDFLKIDIEGTEEVILPACQKQLANIPLIFVEYHSKTGHRQNLDRIIQVLVDAGFRIYINNVMLNTTPFIERGKNLNFDLQLNIFGWRE